MPGCLEKRWSCLALGFTCLLDQCSASLGVWLGCFVFISLREKDIAPPCRQASGGATKGKDPHVKACNERFPHQC